MSAESALLVKSFPVGNRVVTLTVPRPAKGRTASVAVEWSPDVPQRLTGPEFAQYRMGRNAVLAEAARLLGGKGAVIEL